jgi:anti-sigma factor RsiW
LRSYRAGTLPPDRLLEVDDHLARCDDCRARAHNGIDLGAAAATLHGTLHRRASADHCSYETLEAYVDGHLPADQLQQVSLHLETCPPCAEDLGDLRQARALLQIERPEAAAHERGFWASLAALWQHGWTRIAGGAVATALTVWLVFALMGRDAGPGQQIARDTPQATPGAAAPKAEGQSQAAAVVAAVRDGSGEVALRSSGEVVGLPALSDTAREAVRAALATGRLSIVATAALVPRAGVLRGTEAVPGFDVRDPAGRVVESDRPTFAWNAHPSARTYRVAVVDTTFSEVASSGDVASTEWVPASPLPRGKVLLWQVTAITPEGPVQAPVPPAAEARFSVLERAKADEIDRVRRAEPTSHLALAVLYAQAGMRAEAERELSVLASRNPESALARQLISSVQTPR